MIFVSGCRKLERGVTSKIIRHSRVLNKVMLVLFESPASVHGTLRIAVLTLRCEEHQQEDIWQFPGEIHRNIGA